MSSACIYYIERIKIKKKKLCLCTLSSCLAACVASFLQLHSFSSRLCASTTRNPCWSQTPPACVNLIVSCLFPVWIKTCLYNVLPVLNISISVKAVAHSVGIQLFNVQLSRDGGKDCLQLSTVHCAARFTSRRCRCRNEAQLKLVDWNWLDVWEHAAQVYVNIEVYWQ